MIDDAKINKLHMYGELEGTELGGYVKNLCNTAPYYYCMTDQFLQAMESEIDHHLNIFETQTTIITTEEVVKYTNTTLEWNDESEEWDDESEEWDDE